ncbi:hypothetical protein Mgra_00006237 [Meloidogyne graminicola]|uniref:Uncharacterized protein n=1 Tax=Meloidogyne graminicola TaxID=189291 RepID=A0A8S9ZMF2_9BILA|nr:hypothetical protein Mgra_00006237 [Meloidogyne graminicola]
MSIAWFDAFRENGAPTYGDNTPTPVLFDLGLAVLVWLFATPTIAFILILPGIRRLRLLSTFCFLFSMSIGASICLCLYYPGWHYGEVKIFTTLRAHSRQRIEAILGVNVGLKHVNITLTSDSSPLEEWLMENSTINFINTTTNYLLLREQKLPQIAESDISLLLFGTSLNTANFSSFKSQQIEEEFYPQNSHLFYNERFDFDDVSGMEVGEVLQKGLPFPILRVMEYLSVDRTGFLWGKQYRLAGLAFALWLLQMVFLCAVPTKFGQISLFCGLTLFFSNVVYAWYTPGKDDLFLIFPGPNEDSSTPNKLNFHLSTCFYIILLSGLSSTIIGSLFWLLEEKSSFRLETFFSIYLDGHSKKFSKNEAKIWRTISSNNRLPTPRGSFTSIGGGRPSQRIGWKRRRRSLWRTAKPWAQHFHQLFPESRPPRTSIRFGIGKGKINTSQQPPSSCITTTTHSSSPSHHSQEPSNRRRTIEEEEEQKNSLKFPLNSFDDFSSQNSSTCSPVFDNTFGDSIDSTWRHTEEIITDNELLPDRIIAEETGMQFDC